MYFDTLTISVIVVVLLLVSVVVVTLRSDSKETAQEIQRLTAQVEDLHARQMLGVPNSASRELCCALRHHYPAAVHGIDYRLADDGDGPYIETWMLEEEPLPDDDTVARMIDAYRDTLGSNHFHEKRRQAYPSISDQLDALYKARHGDDGHLRRIDEQIGKVKARHPKPDTCPSECDIT